MARSRKARVLVADAEAVARFGLVQLINSHVSLMVCAEAETLGAARDLVVKHQPEIVVFDPAMGDGVGFIKDLPQWCSHTRLVAFTALGDAHSIQRAFKAGVCGYVTRRDSVVALMTTVVGALEGKRRVSPRVESALLDEMSRGNVEVAGGHESVLSNRELQVFRLLGQGMGTRDIARELSISVKTIETHRQRIREKLRLANGSELRTRAVLSFGDFAAQAQGQPHRTI